LLLYLRGAQEVQNCFYIYEVKIEIWSVETKNDGVAVYETAEGSLNGPVAIH